MPEERFETDDALVEGLKAGEQFAQIVLVRRHGPRVMYLIKFISWDLPTEDVKEVSNEVFRRVIRGIPKFEPGRGAKFTTWLFRIVIIRTSLPGFSARSFDMRDVTLAC